MPRGLIWIALTVLAWGSAFPAIRLAVRGFSPGALALLRFAVAALLLAPLLSPLPRLARRDQIRLALCALAGVTLYHLLLNSGSRVVEAGASGMLIGLSPVFAALFASLSMGERLGAPWWQGTALAFAGSALIATRYAVGGTMRGVLLVLAAAVLQGFYFATQKPLLQRMTPASSTAFTIWLGMLPLLVFTPALLREAGGASPQVLGAAVCLGVVPSGVAYFAWAQVLRDRPASRASAYLYLVPPVAVLLGWLLLDERLGPLQIVGGAIALAGVIRCQRVPPKAAAA